MKQQNTDIGRIIRPIAEADGPLVPIEMLRGYTASDFIRVLNRISCIYGNDSIIMVDAPAFEMMQHRIDDELNRR